MAREDLIEYLLLALTFTVTLVGSMALGMALAAAWVGGLP